VHERRRGHVEPASAQHVQLDRQVVEMGVLHPGRHLDLAQPPAAARQSLEHVDAHPNAVGGKACLEDRRDTRIGQQRLRAPAGLLVGPGFGVDRHASGKQVPRQDADVAPEIEQRPR
jgi:hypothetical protein